MTRTATSLDVASTEWFVFCGGAFWDADEGGVVRNDQGRLRGLTNLSRKDSFHSRVDWLISQIHKSIK